MKKKIIVVVGPTASGKSDLTFKIAKDLKFEIVVCDAYQVYKEISKGINKPNDSELKAIKHNFVNHISIYDKWDVKRFKEEFEQLIENNSVTNFILEGGSNLYIHALVNNYNLQDLNDSLTYDEFSNEQLFEKLKALDYEESLKINVNNRKRIEQALRIIESTHQKKSVLDKQNKEPLYDFFIIRVKPDREKLYKKINERADKMYSNGWLDEVKQLKQLDENVVNLTAFKALGYVDMFNALNEGVEVDFNKIKKKTRQYAKRQETWIKNKFDVHYQFKSYEQYGDLLEKVREFLNGKTN